MSFRQRKQQLEQDVIQRLHALIPAEQENRLLKITDPDFDHKVKDLPAFALAYSSTDVQPQYILSVWRRSPGWNSQQQIMVQVFTDNQQVINFELEEYTNLDELIELVEYLDRMEELGETYTTQ